MNTPESLRQVVGASGSTFVVHWFRRDLRLEDNASLYHALGSGHMVLCVFLYDPNILGRLEDRDDARVDFIHRQTTRLQSELRVLNSALWAYHADPVAFFQALSELPGFQGVYANRDYEPQARERDRKVYDVLVDKGFFFKAFKDQVLFEKSEVVKADETPYTVFTPYMKRWKQKRAEGDIPYFDVPSRAGALFSEGMGHLPSLESMGFVPSPLEFPPSDLDLNVVRGYAQYRDLPSLRGTTRLSVHLRFGTVSLRQLVRSAEIHSENWLNELIWREFYMMILYHYPYSVERSFKPAYDAIQWETNEAHFEAWCSGKTGYPLVDAGMRELNATGFMHNRVRMVVASFLTKHLLIDWRWGERYFARKLLDFELSSNVGGWQWAASSGCDAAPYFRVFNPELQQQRFDPQWEYIRRWVPEWNTPYYPKPIVDHRFARERVLARFKQALDSIPNPQP
ncbi:deoxyribodipyrimidine photo-lyase [bacterium]|nr:deoxyribodipyrimidine photo-lyase [bacterium]